MKIAIVGDFLYHGKFLPTIGTSILLALSMANNVDRIEVYSPAESELGKEFILPSNVKVVRTYNYDNLVDVCKLLIVKRDEYNFIIFNFIPTAFGRKSIVNAFGLLIPFFLRRIFGVNNIKLIYHNSVFTSDIRKLGYDSRSDRARLFVLKNIERLLFNSTKTYVLLDLYREKIEQKLNNVKIYVLNSRYIEALPTIYLNQKMDIKKISAPQNVVLTILMHGYWGPQKNLELGLKTLESIRKKGHNFKLIISGGLNFHFPEYHDNFFNTLNKYKELVDACLGMVDEANIMDLFLSSDLLILPYNTPGGHSGVLEQAIFFDLPTVAIDFPEYREQAEGVDFIKLVPEKDFESALIDLLTKKRKQRDIEISNKIKSIIINVGDLIKE